jgi:hypothetical protein
MDGEMEVKVRATAVDRSPFEDVLSALGAVL